MDAQTFLKWTCIAIFVLTAIITFLALLGKIKLGGETKELHHYYLKRLFTVIIIQASTGSVLAFKNEMK